MVGFLIKLVFSYGLIVISLAAIVYAIAYVYGRIVYPNKPNVR